MQARWLAVISLSAACLVGTATAPVRADAVDDAVALVEEVRAASATLARDGITPHESRVLREAFAWETIARVVLGDYWTKASTTERRAFVDALFDAIVHGLARRLGTQRSEDFTVAGTRTITNGDVLVRTRIARPPKEPITIDWRVRRCDGSACIVDVLVSGGSVSLRRRDEVTARMAAEGASISKLIADLRQEAATATP